MNAARDEPQVGRARKTRLPARTPAKVGRPTVLTPTLQAKICDLVAEGVPFDNACRLCGVGKGVGNEWLRRGLGHDKDRPPAPEFAAFAQAIAHARARDERRRLALITAAGAPSELKRTTTTTTKDGVTTTVEEVRQVPGDWRSIAWVLERRDPERWAQVQAIAPSATPAQVHIDMREVLERIEAKGGDGNGRRALPAAPPEPRDPRPPRRP